MLPQRDITIRGYVVGQSPNAPALIAGGAAAVGRVVDGGVVKQGADAVHVAAVTWWSVLEVTSGVNLFRRLLGIATLGLLAARIYDERIR